MSELANYFIIQPGLDIHLVMFGRSPELFYHVSEKVKISKPITIFNDKFRGISTIRRLIFLRRTILNINPDVVLSFGELWNSFIIIALLGTNTIIYVSDRCQPGKPLGILHTILRKALYPKVNGVIVQTQQAKHVYMKIMPKAKIHVIGNPILVSDNQDLIIKENIVLSVGRLIKTKHHDELIKIFCELSIPGWKLVIVGGDALKQQNKNILIQLIKDLNAEQKVILAGSQKNTAQFYKKAKIFAFTSSSEGFPNVIGEALAFGLPTVAYDCIAGPSEIIENGENGFLIPLYDKELFKKKLNELMVNDNLRSMMSKSAIESIKRFHVDYIGTLFLDLLLKNESPSN